jgi:parallel beta-helix repeat protein
MSPVQARTWIVDDDEPADFHTIHEAISAANQGDTIYVRSGIYYERVTIDKPLSLIGENRSTTIIDGNGTIYACIQTTPYSVHDVCISGFTIRNGYWGIYIDQNSQANNIDDNIVTDNQCGIFLFRSDSNIITNNVATNNDEGITIGFSTGNTLVNNTMSSNKYGLYIYGDDLSHFIHNIDPSNKIDGKSVYYLINQHNLMINSTTFSEIGYLGLINSTNITVEDLNCSGILFAYTNSSTIQNVKVSSSVPGIFLAQSFENTISNSSLFKNGFGIKVYSHSSSFCNNTIINNFISDNDCGILLDSDHNTIVNNTITSNKGTGIHLYYCEDNTLKDNHIGGNRYNFEVEGGDLDDFVHDIDTSNTVDGKPLYYWVTQHNLQIPVDAGFVAVVNSTNITVKDLNLKNNSPNVLFAYTRNSTIENITASNSLYGGIELFSSSDNVLVNNVVLNSECGIDIQGSYNNVTGNFVSLNRGGVSLSFAHNNKIDNNLISENEKYGISFWVSYNNTVRCNTVLNNYRRLSWS